MNNIVSVKLDSRYASTLGVWQYDYGQVLRITGPELPPAVEVQFSPRNQERHYLGSARQWMELQK